MKKAAVAALVLLALTVSVPAAAFELSGGLWSVSEQELIPANQIENVYRANLTLVRIGPLRLTG
ncbi:MAG: hypothetical protein WBK00_01930, partial [Limnochordia bacterium]